MRRLSAFLGGFHRRADPRSSPSPQPRRYRWTILRARPSPTPSIHNTEPITMDDVIIIGGSFAGLAGALQLGRARRKVTVLDIPRSGWSMPGPTASQAPSTISPSSLAMAKALGRAA
jgi:hypothetical protein